jgi:hypothetical protein
MSPKCLQSLNSNTDINRPIKIKLGLLKVMVMVRKRTLYLYST